jgi:integrase
VANASNPGLLHDGGGLYLQVTAGGAKSWLFRYMLQGRRREMGLGSADVVSLKDARAEADLHRAMVKRDGLDPIEERRRERDARKAETARVMSFEQCAEAYITAHEAGWRNPKHRQQWRNTLKTYAYPVMGDLPVQEVDTNLVLQVLEPIWRTKTETATRLRGRIESVLEWATVRNHRSGDNPARWGGQLKTLLPAPGKIAKVQHMKALPYGELEAFMKKLRLRDGSAARALEFQILTVARPGEVVNMVWEEVDLARGDWSIPAERMKMGREHRVPLSEQALALLRRMAAERPPRQATTASEPTGMVFRGSSADGALSNNAVGALLKRMKVDVTGHGFRSTFSDWCAECTPHSSDLREMALAHAVSNKVEAAYRRGDMFEKRRALMQQWSDYAFGEVGGASHANIVRLGV